MVDQHALQIIASTLSLKIDHLIQMRRNIETKKDVLDTIRLAGEICTQRSLPELALHIKKNLPLFMGFEAVAIMFRDQKGSEMFTVNEISADENPTDLLRDTLEGATGERQTQRFNTKKYTSNDTAEILVPSNIGITGQVAKSKQVFFSNDVQKEKNFQDYVDNQSEVKDVKSMMIGPVFGH